MDYQKLPNWQKIPELKGLLDLPSPPKELFYIAQQYKSEGDYIGTLNPDIFKNCTGIVGSRKMAEVYLNGKVLPCRIDVVAIILSETNELVQLNHYENVC